MHNDNGYVVTIDACFDCYNYDILNIQGHDEKKIDYIVEREIVDKNS